MDAMTVSKLPPGRVIFMSEKVKVGLSFLWKTSTHEYFTHVTNFLQATKVNYPNILLIRKKNYGNLVMKGQY